MISGGKAPTADPLHKGCYVEPTIRRARSPKDRIAQEEVFGPFVTVLTFKDDDDALRIANGTDYDWAAGCGHATCSVTVARELHAGMVWINSYKRVNPGSPRWRRPERLRPRDAGFDAMREYTQVKSVWVNVDAQIAPRYPR